MQKTWTDYPTDRDRKARRNGTKMRGQVWSDAPERGGQWVVPYGERRAVLVITRKQNGIEHAWSVGVFESSNESEAA